MFIACRNNQQPALSAAAISIEQRLESLTGNTALWGWIARISFGAFFEIYETALTTFLPPLLTRAGIFRPDDRGLFGLPDLASFSFATFIGLFAGAYVCSGLADRYGRRPIFTYSLIWYAIATVAIATTTDPTAICVWRLIAAIGVGGEIVAVDAYISDIMPRRMRGRGFAVSKSIQYLAVPVAAILAAVLSAHAPSGLAAWQWMLMVPAIGALLIWWVRRGLPESPRWLAAHGRATEAAAILDRIERRATASAPPVAAEDYRTDSRATLVAEQSLFRGELLRRLVMLVVISCCITIAYFGFGTWLPSLLVERGVGVTKSLFYSALVALSYPLAPLLFTLIADRVERKWQIVAGSLLMAAAGLAFAAQSSVVGWVSCGLLVTVGGHLCSCAVHTYRSELFPTALRARGIGIVYSIDRLAAALNSYVVGALLLQGGATAVLVFIAAMATVAMLTVGTLGPRVRLTGAI